MKILVVEDDRELQGYIKQIFRIIGYEYDCAYTIKESRDKIAANRYDLVLLDLILGGEERGGIEMCREIKQKYPDTAVIILSAINENEVKVKTLNYGADDYICKPFYDEEMLSRIRRVALRRNMSLPENELRMRFDDKSNTVYVDNTKSLLEKDEYLVVKVLYSRAGKGITRENLNDIVHDGNADKISDLDKKIGSVMIKLGNSIIIREKDSLFVMSMNEQSQVAAKKKRILLVEDDATARELVKDMLDGSGFECFLACDGNEGLKKVYDIKPDLVLLDIKIPGINGYKLLEMIKRVNSNLPVVILTGRYVESSDRAMGIDLGADDYLTKDISPDELLARIKTIITAYDIIN